MAAKRLNRTTLSIAPEVRDGLKHIARKDQSYNDLLEDLIKLHGDHVNNQSQSQNQTVGGDLVNQNPPNQQQTQATQTDHHPPERMKEVNRP